MKAVGYVTAFGSAFLFAVGLGIGGMLDPANVLGFLDFAGAWDPALMGVMGGGILVYAALHRLVLKRGRPLFHDAFTLPSRTRADARLLTGAVVFGVGWGLGGVCPGPAITSTFGGMTGMWIFIAAMFVGFVLVPAPKAAPTGVVIGPNRGDDASGAEAPTA